MGIPQYRDGKGASGGIRSPRMLLLVYEMRKLNDYVYILNIQNTVICTLCNTLFVHIPSPWRPDFCGPES